MSKNSSISNKLINLTSNITISDLKEMYYDGEPLNEKMVNAIQNFDKLKLDKLSTNTSDFEFQKLYLDFQILENTKDYNLFL